MKHYLVVGRMCGDDEDTAYSYQVASREEAVRLFIEDMWVFEFPVISHQAENATDRALAEAIGEGVFVNHVFMSDTPIKEAP